MAAVHWFRRDLRLADNPALALAASAGPVVGLFISDQKLTKHSGRPRLAFLADSLADLDRSMGNKLVVRAGKPNEVMLEVCAAHEISHVYATADFGPYGAQRDSAVAAALAEIGVELQLVDTPYAVRPGKIRTKAGTPYKVFTPFSRAWKAHGWKFPAEPPEVRWRADVVSDPLPSRPNIAMKLPPPGEEAAYQRLATFVSEQLEQYSDDRDRPGLDSTSFLSPYLKWGTLHPRQVLALLPETSAADRFRSQLCWRDFYADVLHHNPASARHSLTEKMATMPVDSGPEADDRFQRWATGKTGYPIVDAGMRQLLQTGWMHNRVRMLTASFLVKDLHINWTRGARWFMNHLVDGDLASNNHGWQWVAGTGTDAAPYFRIFNPTTQGKKFDAQGVYVRRWVPEIAHLPDKHLHSPWVSPNGVPPGYPTRLVDHAEERVEALRRYELVKANGRPSKNWR